MELAQDSEAFNFNRNSWICTCANPWRAETHMIPSPFVQREALAFVQEVAAEARLAYEIALQPGDVLLNHNLT